MGTGRPLILSASRRTDLPGFHAEACLERIERRLARLRTRRLYGIVFWTRHVKPFLAGGPLHRLVSSTLDNPVINLTVTGLGGSIYEPGAPATEEVLSELPRLIETFHQEPWRIRWRYDPLLRGLSKVETFKRIAHRMGELGVDSCTFSFPAYRSLKGSLTPFFEQAGIPRWTEARKATFLIELLDAADELGIRLLSCAQPKNLGIDPRVGAAQCIPQGVLERGDPLGESLERARDYSQRSACQCLPSEDIGDYDADRCLGGCVYCYSKAGGPLTVEKIGAPRQGE